MGNVMVNTLSLDCARLTGWCVAHGGTLAEWGEIDLGNKCKESELWKFLSEITARHDIRRVVAEDIYFDKNPLTFMRLANLHGVIRLFCQSNGIELITDDYRPTEWKRALVGDAYASKDKVRTYINNLLHTSIKSDNTTDAIGIRAVLLRRDRRRA